MTRIRRHQKEPAEPLVPAPPTVDLNQVVAYNLRAARELRGWTQDDLAERLEPYLGQRLTQASISAMERSWESDRRREFDAQDLLAFAMATNLPILWFLLPPPGDHRWMAGTTRQVDELYRWLVGTPEQMTPVLERLRRISVTDPTTNDIAIEAVTGEPAESRKFSYTERRKQLLLALLQDEGDTFDSAIDELGRVVDHLRQVGLRGFIAEHSHDTDYVRTGRSSTTRDEPASHDTDQPE